MHLSTIIPSGNGGINKEGGTLGEIALAPVPEALLVRIESLGIDGATAERIRRDARAMGRGLVPEPAVDGVVDFSPVAWPNFLPALPTVEPLTESLQAVLKGQLLTAVTPDKIRAITYTIGREALSKRYAISIAQAAELVGLLDYVFHETTDGYLQIVPNNLHRYKQLYAHKGYVSRMMHQLTGQACEE